MTPAGGFEVFDGKSFVSGKSAAQINVAIPASLRKRSCLKQTQPLRSVFARESRMRQTDRQQWLVFYQTFNLSAPANRRERRCKVVNRSGEQQQQIGFIFVKRKSIYETNQQLVLLAKQAGGKIIAVRKIQVDLRTDSRPDYCICH